MPMQDMGSSILEAARALQSHSLANASCGGGIAKVCTRGCSPKTEDDQSRTVCGRAAGSGTRQVQAALAKCRQLRSPKAPSTMRTAAASSTFHTSCTGAASEDGGAHAFLGKLFHLLRELRPEPRREVIATRLTQAQRKALELWIRARPGSAAAKQSNSGDRAVKTEDLSRSTWSHVEAMLLARPRREALASGAESHMLELPAPVSVSRGTKSRCGQSCPVVHLGYGLYGQAGATADQPAAAAVKVLALVQELCHQADSAAPEDFEHRVTAAFVLAASQSTSEPHDLTEVRYVFRTRVTFSRDIRLSTPLRGSLAAALRDWRDLRDARGESLAAGPMPRPSWRFETAHRQWVKSCCAWATIWAAHGKAMSVLKEQVVAMDTVWRHHRDTMDAKSKTRLHRQESAEVAVRRKIDRLLAREERRLCRTTSYDYRRLLKRKANFSSLRQHTMPRDYGPCSTAVATGASLICSTARKDSAIDQPYAGA
eukprot:gnl/TRDRNA2_/TRDRNA2_75058_c0_seq1.p1 gnl/TRDRNA2_/TRDRNA2_75058_c0~~gnl/TRDRNA2_/TRDRNA2_75058_c0_seq1.p1  ORF type:complete len:484 (-),score=61.96 gnl/TRDRNA2_/TRDRNA2_75058_c0_seq1:24-1475(-)